jgi:Ca2+-binding RTX toxin-like protein
MSRTTTRPARIAGRGAALAAIAVGMTAFGAASADAFTSEPLWGCRASALSVSVNGNNRVEPVLANGNPNTAGGVSPDREQCSNQEAGANNLATPLGIPANTLGAQTASAVTRIVPAIGKAIDQKVTAFSNVENLTLQLPAGGTVALGVAAANATATASCASPNKPAFAGTSQAAGITLGGTPVPLDGLLTALSQALQPLNAVVDLKVNEKIQGSTGIIVRALHIKVLQAANPSGAPLADIIVAESKANIASGEVCNPLKQIPIPPDLDGACPPGSVLDLARVLCVITASSTHTEIIVGRPFQGPSGGTVVALVDARKRYPNSPCVKGTGPKFVIVGTSGRDRITGTNNADRMLGLAGGDSLDGGRGNDCIDTGSGNDHATGGIGDDRAYGFAGRDTLTGNLGKDRLIGGSGNDHLNGGSGADYQDAGTGNDTINAGYGADRVFGGAGRDFINIATQGPRATASCGSGRDKVRLNKKERRGIRNCETVYVLNDR